jgi:L-fuconolactonase
MIDSHQHFWRYDAKEYGWIDDSMAVLQRDFLPPDALREMVRTGITASIAVQARHSLAETRFLLELADRYPFIVGVVGWIDLQADDVGAQLEAFRERPALVGLRHIVQSEPDGFLSRPGLMSAMAQLEPTGLVYDILVYARQLPQAVTFARAFPRQPFVLDHLGKPDIKGDGYREWRRHFGELAALGNVACKLSGLVTEADWRSWTPGLLRPYIDAALESCGPSRLMLGSDWPVCTVAASYAAVVGLVLEAIDEYSDTEKWQILEGTARQTYFRVQAEATEDNSQLPPSGGRPEAG